jgi:ribonuclease J
MRLTIHRGSHEIGGSCVEIATATTRIVLDAGLPLVDADRQPFDQRSIQGKTTAELLANGTLPNVSGLFDDGTRPDAILLSHAHLDHAGLLHLSRPEVPIYATRGTSKMILAAAVFGGQKELDRTRHREVAPRQPFLVGDCRVTPYVVDHSTFGSVAYLVEGEGKAVLYSGDLRTHGRKPGMVRTLIAGVAPRNIDVLVMEGTHFGSEQDRGTSEFELEESIVEHVRSAPALVLASFSPLDVDRLVTFYRVAQRTGRVFVADAYTAFVLYLVASQATIPRPTRDKGIRVFFNQGFLRRNIENLTRLFEPDRITLDEVLGTPEKHLMVFRPSMTTLDFDGQLPRGCRVIYSRWLGYLKNPDWVELQAQIAAAGGDFIPAHASGHIHVADILEFVRAVNPRLVIPIHTFEPQRFAEHFPNARLLQDGEAFTIP